MPEFKHWEDNLETTWGIRAKLSRLEGEYDLNFKADCADGRRFLLKVMRPLCDVALVKMQCDALAHLHATSDQLKVPSLILSLEGYHYKTISDEAGTARLVWVLSFIDGVRYAEFTPKSERLVADIGASLAKLHLALDGFEHDYLQRDFKWNLLQASWICSKLPVIEEANRRSLLASVMADYDQLICDVKALPAVAIHSDINDYNLLVGASTTAPPLSFRNYRFW